MISDETKRLVRKCLLDNGFDANLVSELVTERRRLRDEFAMAALPELASRLMADNAAREAYRVADAMMDRRKI